MSGKVMYRLDNQTEGVCEDGSIGTIAAGTFVDVLSGYEDTDDIIVLVRASGVTARCSFGLLEPVIPEDLVL